MLKMAAVPAIPAANDNAAVIVKRGRLASRRMA